MFRLQVRVQRRVNRNEARMRWKLWDEQGMHLCTAAQLQPRVTSEPIPERLQKGPKTEGGKGADAGGPEWAAAWQDMQFCKKKGNGVDSCECLLSRRSVFARPATLQWVIGNR